MWVIWVGLYSQPSDKLAGVQADGLFSADYPDHLTEAASYSLDRMHPLRQLTVYTPEVRSEVTW
jgi:hypothetical protein